MRAMNQKKLTDILVRLFSVGLPNEGLSRAVRESEIIDLCEHMKEVFMSQAPLIEVDPPIRVCGDTHGQFEDLLRLFDQGGFPPHTNYLFLGDYVDRGRQNLETILLLFCYKVSAFICVRFLMVVRVRALYPKNIVLLRGNHECAKTNRVYGFFHECKRRYGSERIYDAFNDAFACMPLAAVIGERILCMHGGISPQLKCIDQLRKIERPLEVDGPSLVQDLLWADPATGITGFIENTRGASYKFGADVVKRCCEELNIDLIARAHQVVQDGYEFFANRKLVTIFSAPHYCGQFNNAAAMMIVDEHMKCSFQILRPGDNPRSTKSVPTSA